MLISIFIITKPEITIILLWLIIFWLMINYFFSFSVTVIIRFLTFHEKSVKIRLMVPDAVEALPALTHVSAFRPTSTHAVLVHTTARTLIHTLKPKMRSIFSCGILETRISQENSCCPLMFFQKLSRRFAYFCRSHIPAWCRCGICECPWRSRSDCLWEARVRHCCFAAAARHIGSLPSRLCRHPCLWILAPLNENANVRMRLGQRDRVWDFVRN